MFIVSPDKFLLEKSKSTLIDTPDEYAVAAFAPKPGLVTLNVSLGAKTLSAMRNGKFFKVYPIAVGKPATPTPTGTFKIINKQVNPGEVYGTRWMGLSKKGFGIHGTNDPGSIGKAASHGCIRMNNKDIEELFAYTNVYSTVNILP